MAYLLIIWAALLVILVVCSLNRPGNGGGLTLAYFLGLSLIHVPGVLPLLASGLALEHVEETWIGFQVTLLGMAAFVFATVLIPRMEGRSAAMPSSLTRERADGLASLGWRAIGVGAVMYFVLMPLSNRVPSLTAVVSSLATLLILGFWLVLHCATAVSDWRRVALVLTLLPLLPLATLVTGGFIGYGTYWVLSILAFLFTVSRRRLWFYMATPPVVFLGISLFVTYMGQRDAIREAVWQEQASLSDRLDRTASIVRHFELLDLDSSTQGATLDGRLNQNWLVGAALLQHQAGYSDFADGGTVPLWALIPRAVWPSKPAVGGGGDVVTQFTGITFADGTSVGAGQVLEFYVNFGLPGVVAGFAVLGYLLIRLDRGIAFALAAGDTRGFLIRAMPGLTLLQPGGNLLEIIVAAAAAVFASRLVVSSGFMELRGAVGVETAHP